MRSACITAIAMIGAVSACTSTSTTKVGGPPPPSDAHQVVIWDYKFKPDTMIVPIGTTVSWVNRDIAPHTATFRSFGAEAFDSGHMPHQAVFYHKFAVAGSYHYLCAYHQGMQGTVTVK